LTAFGLVEVLSASSVSSGLTNGGNFFYDAAIQSGGAMMGIALALLISRFPISFWHNWRNVFVSLGMVLQLLVLYSPLGVESGGNKNWLNVGFTTIQPSEFLKLAIIVWFASWFHDNEHMTEWSVRHRRAPLIWVLAPIFLVALGGDMGTTIILGAILLGMLAFAGLPSRTLGGIVVFVSFLAVLFVAINPSRLTRFVSWAQGCSPQQYESICWQTMHGLWALSSGGLFGLGPGSSRAKWSWLPHADSDYIFAIVGEELGLVGAVALLVLILALAVVLIRLIREFPQPLTRVLIGGVFVWLIGQALVNIAVVLNLLPVLGVPLPFISSGGSSILANLLAVGVIVSCVRHEERYG
jgi:cell division protein FtsW